MRFETGIVLVLTLGLLILISLLSVHLMAMAIGTTKITASFQSQLKTAIELENSIRVKENLLAAQNDRDSEAVLAFVPDHLEWGCRGGVTLYEVLSSSLSSIFAVRQAVDQQPIFSSQCRSGLSVSTLLDLVKVEEQPILFALRNAGVGTKSVIWLQESETDVGRLVYELPFVAEKGYLAISRAYYANDWHTVLLLTAKDKQSSSSILLAFDISDPGIPLKPFLSLSSQELSVLSTRPVMLRLQDGRFGIAVAGSINKASVLHIVFFDAVSLKYPLDLESVDYLVAVDIQQRGYTDRIYVGNQRKCQGMDILSLTETKNVDFQTSNVQSLSRPWVIPDILGRGVQLYFLGEINHGRGLIRILDLLHTQGETSSAELVMCGDFVTGFVRFEQFWLIPRDMNQEPVVLDLATHEIVQVERAFKDKGNEELEKGSRLAADLYWDLEKGMEMLITLNDSCQLIKEGFFLNYNPYGRLTWQKIRETQHVDNSY